MIKNKKGESLAGIIIWVFILSFVVLWIWNLLWNSRELIKKSETEVEINFLINNSYNIINKIDTSTLSDWDKFYLYKNKISKDFELKIGEINSDYKNINSLWEKIDNSLTYKNNTFTREFTLKKIINSWIENLIITWKINKKTFLIIK